MYKLIIIKGGPQFEVPMETKAQKEIVEKHCKLLGPKDGDCVIFLPKSCFLLQEGE